MKRNDKMQNLLSQTANGVRACQTNLETTRSGADSGGTKQSSRT